TSTTTSSRSRPPGTSWSAPGSWSRRSCRTRSRGRSRRSRRPCSSRPGRTPPPMRTHGRRSSGTGPRERGDEVRPPGGGLLGARLRRSRRIRASARGGDRAARAAASPRAERARPRVRRRRDGRAARRTRPSVQRRRPERRDDRRRAQAQPRRRVRRRGARRVRTTGPGRLHDLPAGVLLRARPGGVLRARAPLHARQVRLRRASARVRRSRDRGRAPPRGVRARGAAAVPPAAEPDAAPPAADRRPGARSERAAGPARPATPRELLLRRLLTGLPRRRLTAAFGVYASTALGIAGSLVVFRVLGPAGAGRYSIVMGAVGFVSLLLELTSDEALVKYGFRYAARDDWGRFHRLVRLAFSFELAAAIVSGALIAALAPFVESIFHGARGLETAMLAAAPLPALEAVEAMGAAALILRGRYGLRGLALTGSMALRLTGLAVGSQHGVTA